MIVALREKKRNGWMPVAPWCLAGVDGSPGKYTQQMHDTLIGREFLRGLQSEQD